MSVISGDTIRQGILSGLSRVASCPKTRPTNLPPYLLSASGGSVAPATKLRSVLRGLARAVSHGRHACYLSSTRRLSDPKMKFGLTDRLQLSIRDNPDINPVHSCLSDSNDLSGRLAK